MAISNDPSQTIPGSYRIIVIDNEEVVMQKVNGKWVTTAERLEREKETAEFMSRFDETDTKPKSDIAHKTSPLTMKTDVLKKKHLETSNHLDAYLGEILGAPEDLLKKDKICMDKVALVKARPQELRHVLGLIRVFNNPLWNRIRDEVINV